INPDPVVASLTSSTGAWQWAGKCLYGTGSDYATGLSVDAAGVLYVGGTFNSSPFTYGNGNGILGEIPGNTPPGAGYSGFVGKVWAPPTVTGIVPASAPVGATITLTGANLSSSNFVKINGVMTNIVVNSATSITAVVPAGANLNARPRPLKVNNLNGGPGFSLPNFTVTGSVTVLADSVAALPGTVITVPVRVRGFQGMAALQGSLTFDATKLTFAGITQLGLPGMVAANVASPASGQLSFAWNNPTNAATTVADNGVIFAVKFSVGALAPGASLPLSFANAPVSVLVMKADFTTPTIVTLSGKAQAPLGSATLSGGIATSTGALVPGVIIVCTPLAAAQGALTNANGQFTFPGLVATGTYGLYPSKANDVTVNNGLSVLDLALMQRHILGVAPLANAYKVVAADVDRSGTVTVADVALARGVLLGSTPAFPMGRRWVFVRNDQSFVNQNAPWPIDTFRIYNSLTTAVGQGFVGCRLGDIDNSWDATIPRPAPGVVPVALRMEDVAGQPGQRLTVPVRIAGGFQDISALQLTAAWDPAALRLAAAAAGDLPGVAVNQIHATATGRLPLVWTDAAGTSQSRPAGAVVVYLTFDVLQASGATALDLTSDVVPAQAYDHALALHALTVRPGSVTIGALGTTADAAAGQSLLLYPNPARETVTLRGATAPTAILLNGLGRPVRTWHLQPGSSTLDLRGLPMGLYTVRAGITTRQLVVE
ncbi:MAG: IPT/TIG domain-containing protein, partial [Hymenobacteraceae bacterium]|nr:IPT/TIG domain-containing protein [Hymenobacteraceae bacterium]